MFPSFCPYKACPCHTHPPKNRWWHSIGYHDTRCFGKVPRFRCLVCKRSFSTQTFSTNYYAKRKIDYRKLERLLASSMSIRSLARALGCSCGSILNRSDRLARQAIAAHSQLRPLVRAHEDVCIDGFVSFDRSQFFPNNITIAITSRSRFILSFTHATLRRSGCMRPSQKTRRDELYSGLQFEPRALERSFQELFDQLSRERAPGPNSPLVIVTDEKLEYERAFSAHPLFLEQDDCRRVAHLTINSKLPRTYCNPLFASNYLDRELRKDQAAHRRETACFCRNVANGLSRLACYANWHNYRKRFLIKAPVGDKRLHGEVAGIPSEAIIKLERRMYSRRAFLSLLRLDELEQKLWLKRFPTPGKNEADYLPLFAFA